MAKDRREIAEDYLSCSLADLPSAIKMLFESSPRSTTVLAHVKKVLETRKVECPILAECIRAVTECCLPDLPETEAGTTVLNSTFGLLYLLIKKNAPLEDLIAIFRCANKLLPATLQNRHTKILFHLANDCLNRPYLMCTDPRVQELRLWVIWYRQQVEDVADACESKVLNFLKLKRGSFACMVLKSWSSKLNPVDTKLASRLTTSIIELASEEGSNVFDALWNLKLRSPLNASLSCLLERRIKAGLEAAELENASLEYLKILEAISRDIHVKFQTQQKEPESFWRMAKLLFAILRCCLPEANCSMDQSILILRHMIFHRAKLPDGKLETFCRLLVALKDVLPFADTKHPLWTKESTAKFGNAMAPLIKISKDHSIAIVELFTKIMRMMMTVNPSTKESMQMFRTTTSFAETALFVADSEKSKQIYMLTPPSVFDLLSVCDPEKIDAIILLACEATLMQHGASVSDYFGHDDPNLPKWLALELYALLRLNAESDVIAKAQDRLQKFADESYVSVIISALDLRARAQNGAGVEQIEETVTSHEHNVLVQAARKGILFGLKHMDLSTLAMRQHHAALDLMREKAVSGHEQMEQLERAEFSTDMAIAFDVFCLENYIDLIRIIRWIPENYKRLQGIPFWVMLSSFLLDDVRTAASYYAINGDYTNQLKLLSCLQVFLENGGAPRTMAIDNKLRIVDALLFAGCTENARFILKKQELEIKELPMYSEEIFYLQNKCERLRVCLLVAEHDANPPEDMSALMSYVRAPTLDKLRLYSIGRYFHGKALHQWNLNVTGQLVATDSLESSTRNALIPVAKLREKNRAMTTWEEIELTHITLMSDSLRVEIEFDMGSISTTVAWSAAVTKESQRMVSYYFLLRQIELMIRMALLFELSIDSKLALVNDLLDPKRRKSPSLEESMQQTPDDNEDYHLQMQDTLPHRTAFFLKLKQHRIDVATRRVPAKEFLKLNKRLIHVSDCRCPLCTSIGIDLTVRRIDAVSASVTKKSFVALESSIFQRLSKGLKCISRVVGEDTRPEKGCERIAREVEITHAFHLARGYASDGEFHESLKVLDHLVNLELTNEEALELCIRKFEYTYQINWQEALKALAFYSNSPVEIPVPTPAYSGDAFKTPAPIRKREVKNLPARRKVRMPFGESGDSSGEDDAPVKKIPKKGEGDNDPTTTDVVEKARPKRTCVRKAAATAPSQKAGDADKPTFIPLDEFSGVTTRRKKNASNVARSETTGRKIESVDDVFDDGEMSFVETFSRMNFRDRLKKPKQVDQCNAEEEFQVLLEAGRRCTLTAKQSVLSDLFLFLAFLSAHRKKKDEFIFYLEKSLGIGVQRYALNRGSRLGHTFEREMYGPEYCSALKPTTKFDPKWYERIWEWCHPDWMIVQLSSIMEGGTTPGLVVVRYENGFQPEVVHLSAKHDAQFQGSLLKHFDDIQIYNKATMKDKQSKNYWNKRHEADELLVEFCASLENSWMSCWRGMFRPDIIGPEKQIIVGAISRTISFAESHGLKVDKRMLSIGLQGVDALPPEQLTAMLSKVVGARNGADVRKVHEFAHTLITEEERGALRAARRKPVILVLDKHLINICFDSCPLFTEVAISRMPSIAFTIAHAILLKKRSKGGEDPFALRDQCNGCYCVNPGGDLKNCEERFMQEMACAREHWEGVTGEPLSREMFRTYLQTKELYLYCGHGTGRQYVKEHIELLNVRAVSLIIGCSSAKMKKQGTTMDIEGYALRLLTGGAAAVLGNLWDVTDKDIDAFTHTLLSMWLDRIFDGVSTETHLAAACSKSRKVCKLKALSGAAPVVFGLPVTSKPDMMLL